MTVSFYGCTAAHSEFTCLQAWYVGGKKWKTKSSWCEHCSTHYQFPEKGKS